eukprot:m.449096 g.449096  ORF g.449096 m.449096 type:complete len:533 (-) comp20317_c0_seq1:22-1620(-)
MVPRKRWTRWTVLAAALLVETVGGLFYMFGVFSDRLKAKSWPGGSGPNDTLTQSQLQFIGSSANLGGNFAIWAGFLYDFAGPTWTILSGGVLGCVGWLLMWAALRFDSLRMPYGVLNLVSFLQGQAQAIMDIGVIPTMLKHFPDHRGTAIGITKSFVGLSGALATQYYVGFFSPNITSFLLFLAIEIVVITGVGMFFIHAHVTPAGSPTQQRAASKRFTLAYGFLGIIALQLLVTTILDAVDDHEPNHFRLGMAVTTAILTLVLFVFVGIGTDPASAATSINSAESDSLLTKEGQHRHLNLKQYSLLEAIQTPMFWLQFFGFMTGGGAGLVVINNIAQMNKARHSRATSTSSIDNLSDVFVSMLSICNCFGRLGVGLLGDALISWKCIPRPFCFALANAIMALSHLLLLMSPTVETLYVACILVGLSYGAMNALSPTQASEIFGTARLGSIYAGLAMSIAGGSLGLAKGLAGAIYDKHATVEPGEDSKTCYGHQCFQVTFIVSAGLSVVGTVCMCALGWLTRGRYQQMYRPN